MWAYMPGDATLFFGLWLQRPLQIAAITPSIAGIIPVGFRLGATRRAANFGFGRRNWHDRC
jgi:hypothetical protein